jgi:hypothetical protein
MIIPVEPSARGAPRGTHAQSSCKCTTVVVATFSLVTAFVLAGAPTATAAMTVPTAMAVTTNHVTSISGLYSAPCRGKKPGVCPKSRFV